jgi:osmotically-inducible protein OsmY
MRIVIGFILGIVVGAYSLRVYEKRNEVPPNASNPAVSDTTREAADGMGQAVSEKLAQWHLTPDEVKADLSHSGQVVREKAQVAGATIVDDRIVTVIKAKYILDHHLSARDLSVDCHDGVVTLRGVVPATSLISRAVMLALDTDGVVRVISQISIRS